MKGKKLYLILTIPKDRHRKKREQAIKIESTAFADETAAADTSLIQETEA